MFDVIRSNVRVPEQVFGDLMANMVGARQLLEFMDEYALDDLAPLSAAIRDRIAALPDGIYEGTLDIEGIDDGASASISKEVLKERVRQTSLKVAAHSPLPVVASM